MPTVGVKARAQKDKILLRWAVNQPMAWKIANNYGFYVERVTVARDSHPLKNPEIIRLTNQPLKPQPVSVFDKIALTNNQAAIIAEALYGKQFNVGMTNADMTAVLTKNEELIQRFTFSLMAADQNFEAALLAGWAFVDSTAKTNEKYVYRVFTAVPESKLKIDYASIFVGLSDFQELPPPIDVSASFGNKTVALSWNYAVHKNLYTAYFVEQSEDSINFKKVSDLPITNLITKENESPSMMV